jgi:N12 class adenine-specific DNA methylase
MRRAIEVNYSEYTAEWSITNKANAGRSNIAAFMTYGTDRANAYKILEDTLNLRDVRIYDTKTDADGKERRVLNNKETTLAQQKQQAIKDAFRDWIWKDPDRRQTLVTRYNELFNSTRPREYDVSHITFSGMNPEIQLREHQLMLLHTFSTGATPCSHTKLARARLLKWWRLPWNPSVSDCARSRYLPSQPPDRTVGK